MLLRLVSYIIFPSPLSRMAWKNHKNHPPTSPHIHVRTVIVLSCRRDVLIKSKHYNIIVFVKSIGVGDMHVLRYEYDSIGSCEHYSCRFTAVHARRMQFSQRS